MKKAIFIAFGIAVLAASGCTKTELRKGDEGQMHFSPALPGTKATDTSFEEGDAIGIYALEYVDGVASPLQLSGNWANNAKAVLHDGSWEVSPAIWWKEDCKFDIISYYPYCSGDDQLIVQWSAQGSTGHSGGIKSVDDMPFSVQLDQRESGYTRSDLMWAKTVGVTRTDGDIPLNFKHKLSRLDINLIKGPDYEGEIPADAEVRIMSTVPSALVNLESGDVERDIYSSEKTITAHQNGRGSYSAIIVPQMLLNNVPLVEIIAGDVSYILNCRFQFESGVRHTLNITMTSDPDKAVINIGGGIENWN